MAPKKILVLGAVGFPPTVEAYAWDRLPDNLNVADFDVVFLNLTAFEDDEDLRTGIPLDRLPNQAQFARLIFSNSEVFAIGSLYTTLGDPTFEPMLGRMVNSLSADWWLPTQLDVVTESGDVRDPHYEWESYFRLVRRFAWYFDHLEDGLTKPRYHLGSVHPEADALYIGAEVLASTRFGKAVAAMVRFGAARTRRGYEPYILTPSGSVFLLPRPTEVPVEDGIDVILRERFEVASADRPPEWVQDFQLPNERRPREEVVQNHAALNQAQKDYEAAVAAAQHEARFRKLLYETGEDVLEPVARDALRELGARVTDPEQQGREDGRLEYPPDRRGMLEIKGRKASLRLSDVRELDQWVRDALVDWPSKGLLIACLGNEHRPGERRDLFPENCVRLAERAEICLLTTTQLYEALRQHQLGELDVDHFFETVFSTSGVCELPELQDPKPHTEEPSA